MSSIGSMKRKNDYQDAAGFMKALAHRTRLAIVRELGNGEKCVTDIEDLLDVRQANISQHLAILRREGIVECRREGKSRCYHLKDPTRLMRLLDSLGKIQKKGRDNE